LLALQLVEDFAIDATIHELGFDLLPGGNTIAFTFTITASSSLNRRWRIGR